MILLFPGVVSAEKIAAIPPDGKVAVLIHEKWQKGHDLDSEILLLEHQWSKAVIGKKKEKMIDDPRLKQLDHDLKEKREEQAKHYLRAAGLSAYAYGLAPDEDASKSQYKNANAFGVEMRWSLRFRPREFELIVDEAGVVRKVRPKHQPTGALAPDGEVYLYSGAFSDPATMASTIYHERVHFFQGSTPGWGNILTEAEKQIQAYEGELRLAKVFGTPESELGRIKATLRREFSDLFKKTGRRVPSRIHQERLDGAHHRMPVQSLDISKPLGDPSRLEIHRDGSNSLSPCHAPARSGPRVDMRSLTPNPLTRLNQVRAQNQAQQNQRDLQAESNKLSAPYLARAQNLLNTTRRCSGEGCWKNVYDQGMSLNRDILTNLLPQLQGLTGAAAPSLAPSIDDAFARMNPGNASGSRTAGRDYPSLCRRFDLIKTFAEPSGESSSSGLPVDAAKAAEAERDYQAKLAALAPPPGPDGGLAAAAAPTQGTLYRETPAGSVKTEAATNLGPGDTLRTAPNGKADLNLSNGHRVRLEPGTTLTLGQDEQGRSLYDVISGQIRSAIHCATGESPCALQRAFRSRTGMADATAAVRGTELALAVPASGPVALVVREGLVEFRGRTGRAVFVGAGMRSTVDETGSASPPESASASDLKDWFAGRAPQDEKAAKSAQKRVEKARARWAKAAAKEDKSLRKRYAKDSAPWLARLGGEACLGDDCFSVNPDPEGWGRACRKGDCFDPRRLRPKEEELWLDSPLTKFQTAAGGVILDESEPDPAANASLERLAALNQTAPAPAPPPDGLIGLSLPAKRLLAAKLREEISAAKPAGRPTPFTPDPKAREAFLNSPQALQAYAGLAAEGPRGSAIAAARLAKELFGDGPDAPAAAARLAGDDGRKAAADGWIDAFEAAGLEHGAALSVAFSAWERLP